MLDRLFALETLGIRLGLENTRRLLDTLDHPERAFTTVHIAGTNGKGSVTAMVHAGLVAAGVRAARYVSPHLVHLNERFVIGHDAVEIAALEDVAALVVPQAEALRATFFEATTVIAFELFRRAGAQAAVIEVGLGGRFDATNVLSPVVGAITSIGLDHELHLGGTIAAIAAEKAGIVKPGMTVVAGAMPDEAFAVIHRAARERGARLLRAADGATVGATMSDGQASLSVETPDGRYGPVTLALRGDHQVGNALVAVRVLEAMRAAGLVLPDAAIARGLEEVVWPARLELIALDDDRRLLLDAAHNVDGAVALAAYLARWHPERPTLVMGVMGDKDVDGILRALLPVTSRVIATQADTARALPAAELAARVTAVDPGRAVRVEVEPLRALDRALDGAGDVCVAGSIVVAGAVRDGLRHRAILR